MATAELVVAFGARLEGLEASLKRVNTRFGDLQRSIEDTQRASQTSVNRMESSFSSLRAGVRQVAVAWAALQSLRGAGQLVLQIDDISASIRRLSILTSTSMPQATAQFDRLVGISTRTGQSISNLSTLFTRFTVATSGIGASGKDVEKFVETLAQFARISGQAPQEAASAMIQLSQGLASGRLQGDELKSILENMPLLARALAAELGVSVGELRKMGEEGRLTADNVFPAILRAGRNLASTLEGVPLTLRQAMTAAGSQIMAMLETIDRTIGASTALSWIFTRAAQGAQTVRDSIEGSGPEANMESRVRNARAEVERLTTSLREAEAAERSMQAARDSPLTGRAPRAAISRRNDQATVDQARQRLQEAQNRADILQRQLDEESELDRFNRFRQGIEERARAAATEVTAMRTNMDAEFRAREDHRKRTEQLNRNYDALEAAARQQGNTSRIAELQRERAADVARSNAELAEDIRRAGAGAREAATAAAAARRRVENEARRQREAEQRQVEEIARAAGSGLPDLNRQFREWATAQENVASNYELFIRRIGAGTEQIETLFSAVGRAGEQAAQTMVRAGQDPAVVMARLREELLALSQQLEATLGPARAEEIARAMDEQMRRVGESVTRTQRKVGDTFDEMFARGVKMGIDGIVDGILEIGKTSENTFEKMAAKFVIEVGKMIAKWALLQAIMLTMRAAGWNDMASALAGPGRTMVSGARMAGGPVTAGRAYVVGERRPELFVPSSSGYVYPQVNGGSAPQVVINNNAPGVVIREQQVDERTVIMAVNMSRQQSQQDFRESVSRGYGPYAEPLSSSFNVRRRL